MGIGGTGLPVFPHRSGPVALAGDYGSPPRRARIAREPAGNGLGAAGTG
jgi:hypothetical protein